MKQRVIAWLGDKKNSKYLVLFLVCGVLLMLLPTSSSSGTPSDDSPTVFSLREEEQRLEQALSKIDGVGKCRVLLAVHSDCETILAEDDGETVVLSVSGKQETVVVQTRYPAYQGAIVVAQGSEDAHVRYDILSAIMVYTGLETNKITICPMES